MQIWPEHPDRTDVEVTVRRYFSLLRAGRFPEAEQLVDHTSVRHVLKSLWKGSVGASSDEERAADEWEQDLSWLGELDLADFAWGDAGGSFYVKVTYRARIIEVALGFWIKPTDAGWVLTGPSTLW